jgi:SNF family Na+-dependent transporter
MTLPWDTCGNSWNTENCTNFEGSNATIVKEGAIDSATEYWERHILGISKGLEHPGSIKWDLALTLLLAWVIVYLCICKGIKTSGKVMYFTATFPYVLMMILCIRGATLPGAALGIEAYLVPDWSKLWTMEVWVDAGTQIFFSYSISLGTLTALGSYNKFHHNSFRDSVMFALTNSGTSFFAGFVIFMVLGFMAQEAGKAVKDVAESGPGLAFIAFLLIAMAECLVMCYVYGIKRWMEDISFMFGFHPGRIWQYLWMVATPLFVFIMFIMTIANYEALTYNRTYHYPMWGITIGWCLALMSVVMIPIVAVYKLIFAEGTLKERWVSLTTPILKPHQLRPGYEGNVIILKDTKSGGVSV